MLKFSFSAFNGLKKKKKKKKEEEEEERSNSDITERLQMFQCAASRSCMRWLIKWLPWLEGFNVSIKCTTA